MFHQTMRLIVALALLLACVVSGSRLTANSGLQTQVKAHTKSKTKSHLRRARRTHRVNGTTADDDDSADDGADDGADASNSSEDDSDDSDEADDTATFQEVQAAKAKAAKAEEDKAAWAHHAEVTQAKEAVHDNQWRQQTNAKTLADFNDAPAFRKEIARELVVVGNETSSPALASFLGEIRTEMKEYATASYPSHLEEQQNKLEAEEAELKAKLDALMNNKPTPKPAAIASPDKKTVEVSMAPAAPAATDPAVAKQLAADEAEIKELKEKLANKGGSGGESIGHVFAFAFLGTVTMMAVVFAMCHNHNETVKNYSWFLLDQVTAVFLAVMYFQAFDDLLDFIDIQGQRKILTAIIHALVMLTLALVLAFVLRKHEVGLAIICGAGAHVVSFTSIHAAAVVQNNFWLKIDYMWFWCLAGLTGLGLALAAIGAAVFKVKQRTGGARDGDFMDKSDDMENDFGAMAFSVCWSMFVRFLITGHHPVDDDTEFDHSQSDRNWMLLNAFVSLVVAGVAVPYCCRTFKNYFMNRVSNFFSTVFAMNVAWAFFYWGEWTFFETVYEKSPIFGRVAFALICSTIAALGIFALIKVKAPVPRVKLVALTALGLMVAWSWELCFDAAIDDMVEGRDHPAMYKMAATVFMFLVVIPVYGIYLKPISMPAAEAIGA